MSLRSLGKHIARRAAFQPTFASFIFNPFFLMRSSLYRAIEVFAKDMAGVILDIGCGSKPYRHLFNNAQAYIGCDIQTGSHDHTHSRIDFLYDGLHLPCPSLSIDCVVSFETFEHVFELQDLLVEINRVIKNGGYLLISLPFAWDEHEIPYDFGRYTVYGLAHLLARSGFSIVSSRKTTSYVLALFQLWIAYLVQHVGPQQKPLRYVFQVLVVFPITLAGLCADVLLPKSHQLYSNNVVLARKNR